MSDDRLSWFELHWPREVDARRLIDAFRLLATSGATPIVIEAIGTRGAVVHRLALPVGASAMLVEQLGTAVPGVGFVRLKERPPIEIERAVEVRMSTAGRSLRTDDAESVSRALLTALSAPRAGESVVLQWQLIGTLVPSSVDSRTEAPSSGSVVADVSQVLLRGRGELDAEGRGALRTKRSLPGWRAVGRIGVHAGHAARQRQLIAQVVAALRSAEAPGAHFRPRSTSPRAMTELKTPWRVPVRLNIAELATVSSWPAGDPRSLPVARQSSRSLAPTSAVPSSGRVLGMATFPGRERPVALGAREGLRHLHVIGPTGVGKSTLLLNLIVQDMAAGRAVVVLEPKGDLIADILARIPSGRTDDVVLIEPTDKAAVVGVNPLATKNGSPELIADQLFGVFHDLYASSWGPRTGDIIFNSLLTLAQTPGMSLAALPLLLGDPAYRRHVVGSLDEPLVLQPFWQAFEAWSDAERTAAVAPTLNKVRPLLVRPNLRAVLAQTAPRFELRQVFTERKILLVNLAKGQMGPEAAALLGSLVVSQFWQTALERGSIPAERRHAVFVYVDEFQDYLNLPTDLADALAQARSLSIGLSLSHQHLGQLTPLMRSAVLANARSRVIFQLAAGDARVFGGSDAVLKPDDFRSLGAFEAYAQLVAGDAVQPWLSLHTLPAPPAVSDPDEIRKRSREQFGTSRDQVDRDLHRLRNGARDHDLGPKSRAGADR